MPCGDSSIIKYLLNIHGKMALAKPPHPVEHNTQIKMLLFNVAHIQKGTINTNHEPHAAFARKEDFCRAYVSAFNNAGASVLG